MSRTQVGIIGAGPAGLMLALLLAREGVESTVLEARDRGHVEGRVRAALLEEGVVELLSELGEAQRLRDEGFRHESFEVRSRGRRFHVPLADITNGLGTWIYSQQELLKDLLSAAERRGIPIRFEAAAEAVSDVDSERPVVHYRQNGSRHRIECDVVVGCDGDRGVTKDAFPQGFLTRCSGDLPFNWLAILAEAPPATLDELVYVHHQRGFALHSFRSPQVTRLYLQVSPSELKDPWEDERIWRELHRRAEVDGGSDLNEGPILEKRAVEMRSAISYPLRYRNVFLAGDAAHIFPPTAAKGLNLAVADVRLLATALGDLLCRGDSRGVDCYSEVALREIWDAVAFSLEMTDVFHPRPGSDFGTKIQEARIERLFGSTAYRQAFCEAYAGKSRVLRPTAAPATRPGRRDVAAPCTFAA